MKILVTGGTGFIGSHLVDCLLNLGHHVICLIRRIDRAKDLFGQKGIEFFHGDLIQPETLRNMPDEIDIVFHLAAAGHVSAISAEAFAYFHKINVLGTQNLFAACASHGVKRFIHFSSTAAMGRPGPPVISETTFCSPQTPYQCSKIESESTAFASGRKYDIEVLVLRPCLVYGPGGTGEFLRICKLIKKGLFPRIGRGKNLTPIVHVTDVVQAAINAIEKGIPENAYLVASDTSFPLKEIHSRICEALGIRRPYLYVPLPLAYLGAFFIERCSMLTGIAPFVSRKNILSVATDRTFDIEKAKKELGYCPRVSLFDGIQQTVSWFFENRLI